MPDKGEKTSDKENEKNDKPVCKHERTKKEYYRGMDTGDKICLDCGKLI
jgi:hypothetical protein